MSYVDRFRVKPRTRVNLARTKTDETGSFDGRRAAETRLEAIRASLAELQDRLYAQNRWAVLAVFQAMDAGGKDGTIKHVLGGVNPSGVRVTSFGVPSREELDHDYLWRIVRALPERGTIGAFNRSHYEEVIVTRVHPELLDAQRLPPATRGGDIYRRRCREINRFEHYLVANGTLVLKFFLHVSKHEQWKRLAERMEDPEKRWKAQTGDLRERLHWPAYMAAYEAVLHQTSTAHAPWFVIPADHKWFAWVAVAEILQETLAALKLDYPVIPESVRAEWAQAREELRKA